MFEQCLYFNTTALARRLEREWTVAFKPFGLTPSQAFMLRAVLAQPGMLLSELAAGLGISRPTATRTLDGLVALKLAERQATGRDGREAAVQPTEAARALQADLNRASGSVTRRLKAHLGEARFTTTVDQLRGIRSALE